MEGDLVAGREAFARRAWHEAFERLRAADAVHPLEPDDLIALADAAGWVGRLTENIAARERAYSAFLAKGERRRAAAVAISLAGYEEHRLADPVAEGWRRHAVRLLADEGACAERAMLTILEAQIRAGSADYEQAVSLAREAAALARQFADRDLEMRAVQVEGSALVASGAVEAGLELIDEAAAAAIGGELGVYATAFVYCNTITTCRSLGDLSRAAGWTDSVQRWCERNTMDGFPGHCRVFRAELLRLRGAWESAVRDATAAYEELEGWSPLFAREALHELGEIRLRMGDLAGAEAALLDAYERGLDPQPGLALLRLVQGNVAAARSGIERALGDVPGDRLGRARLLPTAVDVAIASGDLGAARAHAEELESIADHVRTPMFRASASCALGAVELAEGNAAGAVGRVRRSCREWADVGMPYEASRSRMLLALAYQSLGQMDDARLEALAARNCFERLGALLDLDRATALLDDLERVDRAAPVSERVCRTFVFTDIVGSTGLLDAMGDESWGDLLRWHDVTLRSLFTAHGGEEIEHTGDGFFVAFEAERPALGCAVAVQQALSEHRRNHGFAPHVRIGVHASEATTVKGNYHGRGVHEAARIGALAAAGEVLASVSTARAGADALTLSPPRTVTLRGLREPVEVVALDWSAG